MKTSKKKKVQETAMPVIDEKLSNLEMLRIKGGDDPPPPPPPPNPPGGGSGGG